MVQEFNPNPPRFPPPPPQKPTQQPNPPSPAPTTVAVPTTPGLTPTQQTNRRTRPNLQGLVHEQVAHAIRIQGDQIYDLQDAVLKLVAQLVGGALATASVTTGVISATVTAGGYYQVAPNVTITTDGTGYSGTAILTGNRVTGVTIVQGTGATHATITFTP